MLNITILKNIHKRHYGTLFDSVMVATVWVTNFKQSKKLVLYRTLAPNLFYNYTAWNLVFYHFGEQLVHHYAKFGCLKLYHTSRTWGTKNRTSLASPCRCSEGCSESNQVIFISRFTYVLIYTDTPVYFPCFCVLLLCVLHTGCLTH